jgi:leader peptidase (prepilin peptidase) / N-methyltransferase
VGSAMTATLLLLTYLGALSVIAVIDYRTLRAPNVLVLPTLVLVLMGALVLAGPAPREAVLGSAVAFGVLLLVTVAGRGAMGMGDVKYGAVCGAVVGASAVLPMLAFTFIGSAMVALVVLALRLRGRKDVVAFTPFLLAGVVFALVWSNPYIVAISGVPQ